MNLSPTLTIDVDSDPGAWATAIAHTPSLSGMVARQHEIAGSGLPAAREGAAGVVPLSGSRRADPGSRAL